MECISGKNTKTYNTKDSPVVTDLSTDLAISNLSFRRSGVKNQGALGPKYGRLFSFVSVSVIENGCAA